MMSETGRGLDPESLDSLNQLPDVEIDEQTNRAARELEVWENLCLVDRGHFLDGLQFDDDGVFDQQVNPLPAIERHPLVHHGQFLLAFNE
jgi:hypothetical protein